jgi:hypothetical protein
VQIFLICELFPPAVVWSNNCSTAANPRFVGIAFDPVRRRYLLPGSNSYGPGSLYYLSEADMRAGNCSAAQVLGSPNQLPYTFGAAEYIPSMDSMLFVYQMDYTAFGRPLLINMSSPTDTPTQVLTGNWWYNVQIQGDILFAIQRHIVGLGTVLRPFSFSPVPARAR